MLKNLQEAGGMKEEKADGLGQWVNGSMGQIANYT